MKNIPNQILTEINRLEGYAATLKSKWRRNLRLYEYSPTLSLNTLTDDAAVGYYSQGFFEAEDDTTSSVQENIIRSCIDTLVSKIASQKVRPYFNTVNGTFKDMQVVKAAQQYFDALYDDQNVNKVISDAFRDACIFDRGVVHVDYKTKRIERVMPWQVFIDPREASYNHLTKVEWKQENFPTSLLPIKTDESIDTVTFIQYWNLNKAKRYIWIPELKHYEEETFDGNAIPFVFINYCSPIKSTSCQSVVDLLYGIQMAIDSINTKIKDASQLSSPLKYFVPENSTVNVNKLSNRTGEVITYSAPPGFTSSPVTVATEPFMDPQWVQLMDKYKQDAYELVGISQLSATSQKPNGLNSGVALSTMEDIESDRFETQLNTVIRTYTDVARLCIQLFPPEEDILPSNRLRKTIHWRDIVEARDMMSIQFSAAENLSKDPETRAAQVNMLVQMGAIPRSRITQLMEIPDVVQGYSLANNQINCVMTLIDDCIESNVMEVPEYVSTNMLMEEILNTASSLRAASNPNNEADIAKLMEYYRICAQKNSDSLTSAQMGAVAQFGQELEADMSNPNGQIPQALSQAQQ